MTLASNGSWYNLAQFKAETRIPGRFYFACIDGPNEKWFFSFDGCRRFSPFS